VSEFRTDGINGWNFAKHTGQCIQCDNASDPHATESRGVQLKVTTSDLCQIGRKILTLDQELDEREAN
jgi:hypothetical protein